MARIVRRPYRPAERPTQQRPPASLTAAAPVLGGGGNGGVSGGGKGDDGWQADAWNFYNVVPELRYVCQWLSNALSRCQLIPSEVNAETGQPTGDCTDLDVAELVGDIAGGPAGQSQLLGRLATFLTVPGDSWVAIIVRPDLDANGNPVPGTEREEWHVLSKDEVNKKSGSEVEITLPDGTKHVLDDDTDSISRVWRPHPRNATQSDSPVRACLPVLREILRLGQWVEATAKSRLTGAGLLAIASELSAPRKQTAPRAEPVFGTTPDGDAPTLPTPTPDGFVPPEAAQGGDMVGATQGAQDLMDLFIEVAQATIQDPNAASATVPVVIQGPGEFIDKIKYQTFGQEFTEVVIKLRESATRRLALTLDVPAEVLLGTGDMNHWSAWQVEESAIKLHVEPLLTIICDALTRYILRPLLVMRGHPDPDGFVIWYSTANLALRPNRSADAKEAYDNGVLSEARYLTEIGFDPEEDSPSIPTTDDERFKLAYRMAVKGNADFAKALADMAGIDLPAATPQPGAPAVTDDEEPNDDDKPGGDDVAPVPAQPDGQDETPPDAQVASVRTALFAAVSRRLELAGKRLRTRSNLSLLEGVAVNATHTRLETVPRVQAAKVCADQHNDHDRALAQQCGVVPDVFAQAAHTLATDMVCARIPLGRAQLDGIATKLAAHPAPSPRLRSVR